MDNQAMCGERVDENRNHIPFLNVTGNLNVKATEENFDFNKIFESMKCVDCGMIPSPFVRFICPDGHLYCAECGESLFLKDKAACMAVSEKEPMNEEQKQMEHKSNGIDPLLFSAGRTGNCSKKIQRYPADPIYSALYSQAVWRCPNVLSSGCQAHIKGQDLFAHLSSEECKHAKVALDET